VFIWVDLSWSELICVYLYLFDFIFSRLLSEKQRRVKVLGQIPYLILQAGTKSKVGTPEKDQVQSWYSRKGPNPKLVFPCMLAFPLNHVLISVTLGSRESCWFRISSTTVWSSPKKSSHPILTCYHSAKCITASFNSDGALSLYKVARVPNLNYGSFKMVLLKFLVTRVWMWRMVMLWMGITCRSGVVLTRVRISCGTMILWVGPVPPPSFVCDLLLTLWVRLFSGVIVSSGRTITSVLIFLREALLMKLVYVIYFFKTLIIILCLNLISSN